MPPRVAQGLGGGGGRTQGLSARGLVAGTRTLPSGSTRTPHFVNENAGSRGHRLRPPIPHPECRVPRERPARTLVALQAPWVLRLAGPSFPVLGATRNCHFGRSDFPGNPDLSLLWGVRSAGAKLWQTRALGGLALGPRVGSLRGSFRPRGGRATAAPRRPAGRT